MAKGYNHKKTKFAVFRLLEDFKLSLTWACSWGCKWIDKFNKIKIKKKFAILFQIFWSSSTNTKAVKNARDDENPKKIINRSLYKIWSMYAQFDRLFSAK